MSLFGFLHRRSGPIPGAHGRVSGVGPKVAMALILPVRADAAPGDRTEDVDALSPGRPEWEALCPEDHPRPASQAGRPEADVVEGSGSGPGPPGPRSSSATDPDEINEVVADLDRIRARPGPDQDRPQELGMRDGCVTTGPPQPVVDDDVEADAPPASPRRVRRPGEGQGAAPDLDRGRPQPGTLPRSHPAVGPSRAGKDLPGRDHRHEMGTDAKTSGPALERPGRPGGHPLESRKVTFSSSTRSTGSLGPSKRSCTRRWRTSSSTSSSVKDPSAHLDPSRPAPVHPGGRDDPHRHRHCPAAGSVRHRGADWTTTADSELGHDRHPVGGHPRRRHREGRRRRDRPPQPRDPRIANRLLARVRDYAVARADGHVDTEVAAQALLVFEIDELGLDKVDRAILESIILKFGRRAGGAGDAGDRGGGGARDGRRRLRALPAPDRLLQRTPGAAWPPTPPTATWASNPRRPGLAPLRGT
jgi:hypothetical protein